ncbi:MAG: penicillin-binding protein 4 [Chitinivibrionales bacterium]|nr:penicillin-binding protein 4 [Chitinivibrionales bacterium]
MAIKTKFYLFIFCFFPLFMLSTGTGTFRAGDANGNLEKQILSLVDNGAVVLADKSGTDIFSFNENKTLVPASIVKILTAHIALYKLGKHFRFQTEFYTDSLNNLLIKGMGDPYLISEEIALIAQAFKKKGVASINRIFLDHSAFESNIAIPGISSTSNPYDALNGALVVNFNTIYVRKNQSGKIFSAEKQTPLTPIAKNKGQSIGNGSKERINLSSDSKDCLQYAGELFAAILKQHGITVTSKEITSRKISSSWNHFYTHRNSRALPEVLKGLLKYSNNFIANQLFLTIGAHEKGYPATFSKAQTVFEEYIRSTLQFDQSDLEMVEGSGISRDTRATAVIMMQILERFRNYAPLLPVKNKALVKSGTLSGVYNYAGYIQTPQGLRPFVIMLNQKRNTRDSILDLLKKL